MNTTKNIVRLVMAWIAMLAAQIATGMVIHPKSPPNPNPLLFLTVYDAFIVLAIGTAALRSEWRDWRLFRALFVVTAAISLANWIEGAWYLPNVGIDWRGTLIYDMISLAVASLLWLLVFRIAPVPESTVSSILPERSFVQKSWRFAVCSACYVFLYFLAGTIIFPFVRDYYATQHLPSGGQIVAMQFFVRGPIFILVCLTLLRMFRLPHLSGAVAVGLSFTFMSGVAALIMPNGIFPETVRWAHFCEVTSSNLVFGFVVGWVWGQAQRVSHLAHAHA
ncbi:MAG TPA: hypothetical protein VMU45_07815 [Candidatus Eisenbacteria bacterium]|nr:hypothetical protein [Candidatus Eisenbacteria bacterium]